MATIAHELPEREKKPFRISVERLRREEYQIVHSLVMRALPDGITDASFDVNIPCVDSRIAAGYDPEGYGVIPGLVAVSTTPEGIGFVFGAKDVNVAIGAPQSPDGILLEAVDPLRTSERYQAFGISMSSEGVYSLVGYQLDAVGGTEVVPLKIDDTDDTRNRGNFPVVAKLMYGCAKSVQGKKPIIT